MKLHSTGKHSVEPGSTVDPAETKKKKNPKETGEPWVLQSNCYNVVSWDEASRNKLAKNTGVWKFEVYCWIFVEMLFTETLNIPSSQQFFPLLGETNISLIHFSLMCLAQHTELSRLWINIIDWLIEMFDSVSYSVSLVGCQLEHKGCSFPGPVPSLVS